jgi:hypothetical protein
MRSKIKRSTLASVFLTLVAVLALFGMTGMASASQNTTARSSGANYTTSIPRDTDPSADDDSGPLDGCYQGSWQERNDPICATMLHGGEIAQQWADQFSSTWPIDHGN